VTPRSRSGLELGIIGVLLVLAVGLGVLLVVVGMQLFSLGLISDLVTSHHEERAQERDRSELLVDEILS